jgi:hypothetical protein
MSCKELIIDDISLVWTDILSVSKVFQILFGKIIVFLSYLIFVLFEIQ